MRSRSKGTVFFWGFAVAMSLGIVGAVGSGVELPALGAAETEGEPVMVLIVGSSARVERMREAVGAERLLVDTPQGFAVRGGRVVAASHEATGPILMHAGWDDARLDIYLPGSLPKQEFAGDARKEFAAATGGSGTSSRILELMNKPKLSLLESRELLVWMDQNQ